MDDTRQLYDEYHRHNPFEDFGVNTFLGGLAQDTYTDAGTVLDFGCGNGYAVKQMRQRGKEWYGLEYSQAAYELHLHEPYFFAGSTKQFSDMQFDMAYSTEVFEHIPISQIDETVEDLCRTVRRYLFMTISLRPSSNDNKYHCTLRPRSWWEHKFTQYGFVVDTKTNNLHQRRTIKSTRSILRPYAEFGPKAKQLCDNPAFELHGEREPYFFCFYRKGVSPTSPIRANTSWVNRTIIPIARKLLLRD